MSNTLLTPSIIAKEAILALENNMVLANLVHRDFSGEFQRVGDKITVRKPATFVSNEFSGNTSYQNATEGSVEVSLDKHLDVSFKVTSKELALTIKDFAKQFIEPAMRAHAQKIDEQIAKLYIDVPYSSAISGTPALADLANLAAVLNTNKVPLAERSLVLNPTTYAKYVALEGISKVDASGSPDGLRNAILGRVMGFDGYMDQNVQGHTKGTLDAGGTGTADAGATSVTVAAGGNAKTVKKGDIITFANTAGVYVCTEDMATLADGSGTLKIYPGLAAAVAGATITVAATHTANLAFHKNAFAMVTRPLETPLGAAKAETITYNGITVRVVYGYDMDTKSDAISIDLLCGFKTLTPELAARLK